MKKIQPEMNFKYFHGSKSDMSDLLDGINTCSICGNQNAMCFSIDYAISEKLNKEEKIGKIGCIACLRKGEFEFWHDTEFGLLNENGLTKIYKHNMANPPPIDNTNLTELRRTPQILTIQQELWLTHCNDFMIYQGTWEPENFKLNNPIDSGRKLFLEMTDDKLNHLWDKSLKDGETDLKSWHATFYVFKCGHCGKLRGNWDCD